MITREDIERALRLMREEYPGVKCCLRLASRDQADLLELVTLDMPIYVDMPAGEKARVQAIEEPPRWIELPKGPAVFYGGTAKVPDLGESPRTQLMNLIARVRATFGEIPLKIKMSPQMERHFIGTVPAWHSSSYRGPLAQLFGYPVQINGRLQDDEIEVCHDQGTLV